MPETQTITVTPDLSFQDFYRSRQLFLGFSPKTAWFYYSIAACAMAVLSYYSMIRGPNMFTVIGLLAVIYIAAGRRLTIYFESKRLFNTFVELGIHNKYSFDSDGVLVESSGEESSLSRFKWDDIQNWKADPEYLLIILSPSFFISIVKAQIPETDIVGLEALLNQHVGPVLVGKVSG